MRRRDRLNAHDTRDGSMRARWSDALHLCGDRIAASKSTSRSRAGPPRWWLVRAEPPPPRPDLSSNRSTASAESFEKLRPQRVSTQFEPGGAGGRGGAASSVDARRGRTSARSQRSLRRAQNGVLLLGASRPSSQIRVVSRSSRPIRRSRGGSAPTTTLSVRSGSKSTRDRRGSRR
ncbi:MAG: hypothetical protein QOI66_2355 [Myxococcales bacterium]|nr:hypothetical protein [Myxococcales bacterium]